MKFLSALFGLVTTGFLPSLMADDVSATQPSTAAFTPWLTGPLIAPTGEVVPVGHYSLQPYLLFNVNTGFYNPHWKSLSTPNFYNVTLQFQVQVGLTQFMDFQIIPSLLYNATQGQSAERFGDLPLILDFQILSAEKYQYMPGIKLGITETFPTGKYQKLNPKKRLTDVSGLGSYSTTFDLVFYKIYPLHAHHFLSMTADVQYTYYAPLHIEALSTYLSSENTHGKIYPGATTSAILSFEYTLTQNWVLALDNVYTHADKDRFRGNPGTSGHVGRPSSEQLSFAPAVEYNFSENLGLIAGSWFSAAGRNAPEFYSEIVSFAISY